MIMVYLLYDTEDIFGKKRCYVFLALGFCTNFFKNYFDII